MTGLSVFDYGDGTLVVDSRLIAARLSIQHESFMRTIYKYRSRIESRFGQFRFEIGTVRNSVGAVNEVVYVLLTEPQSLALMNLSRNTDDVVECKLDLVEAFEKAKDLLRRASIINATLKVYLLDAPVDWSSRGRVFQEDFYREIYRLNGWSFSPGKTRHPVRVAQITVDAVYQRLQPGVWEEMVRKNPRINGKRRYCCHQFLSENIGNPHLRSHLYGITKIMRGCSNWRHFKTYLDRFYPKTDEVQMDILFDLLSASPEDFDRWNGMVS